MTHDAETNWVEAPESTITLAGKRDGRAEGVARGWQAASKRKAREEEDGPEEEWVLMVSDGRGLSGARSNW